MSGDQPLPEPPGDCSGLAPKPTPLPDRQKLMQRLRTLLEASGSHVISAYLFGSVARGDSHSDSDIDIAVLLVRSPESFDELPLALESQLELELGREVQVVTLNNAPPDLIHRVLRDGELLLDRDRAHRIAFEVRSRNLYFDVLPYLREYRRQPPHPREQ